MRLAALALLCGCGFRGVPAGGSDGAMPMPDFAGVDLFGVDLAAPGGANDLATSGGGTGPGPLGALPAGYCCTSPQQCRSRICMSGYCSDECQMNGDCSHWSPSLVCGGNGFCQASGAFTCTDPSTFHYGTIATGRCCTPGFDVASQCAGGLCESTGNITSNPFYCTQGCLQNGDCPGGYLCGSNFCWIAGSLTDPNNYTYSCMP